MIDERQHQAEIRSRCFHPSGTWEEFTPDYLEQTVVDRFETIVYRYPTRPAVKGSNQTLTYEALNQHSNRVAYVLNKMMKPGNDPILFLLAQDIPAIVTMLGALKAGKIYIALEPTYPLQRISQIVNDSQATVLITDSMHSQSAVQIINTHPQLTLLNLDEIPDNAPAHNLDVPLSLDTYAYIIYTSGSMGAPKGVIENHRDIMHFSRVYINAHHICPEDCVGLSEANSFSGAAAKIFSAFLCGAFLVLFNLNQSTIKDLPQWLEENQMTYWTCVPSVFRQLVQHLKSNQNFPHLRLMGFGGDRVTASDIDMYWRYFQPHTILRIGLGASEVKHVTMFYINEHCDFENNLIPVGYCVEDTEVIIVDETDNPLPNGEIGEIVVKSRYITPGYWRQPELTQKVIKSDATIPQIRWYYSGDLGMMRADGCLFHMGRKDHQVKVRGVRIEKNEIEYALWVTDWFKEVLVTTLPDATGEQQLIGYVVAKRNPAPTVTEIRQHLLTKLPVSMLPSAFVFLDALPLNINNKVDLRALPKPAGTRPTLAVAFAAPSNTLEHKLAQIWEDVLSIAPIGIHDHFLDLGGNSLRAMQIVSRISQQLQTMISPSTLLMQATIADMALTITEAQIKHIDSSMLEKMLDEIEAM